MPRPKSSFDAIYPCTFYTPAELLEPDQMYTVYEIARLLQELEPDAELEPGTEEVLLDWAIPWVMNNADELVVAEPPTDADPGFYGLREGVDAEGSNTDTERSNRDAEGTNADGSGGDAPGGSIGPAGGTTEEASAPTDDEPDTTDDEPDTTDDEPNRTDDEPDAPSDEA